MEGAARPERGCTTPSHPSLPSPAKLLPVGAEATGPRDNWPPLPPLAQLPPVGPRHRTGRTSLGVGPALSLPGPASQGRTPSSPSTRHSFQDQLSTKRFEISGRSLLKSGLPYLTGTQEPRKGCQKQQLGRRRLRRHPGGPGLGPKSHKPENARPLPPRAPARAHVDPGIARARTLPPPPAHDSQDLAPPASPRPRSCVLLSPRLRPAPIPAHNHRPCAHAS